jgi:DNA invertase Pin-like site-specific DNA recombinase
VTKLDRLARSTKDLLNIADAIKKKGADFEVLNINLDTKSPTGQLMLTMLAANAEFERGIMLERQREGIDIAKADGKYKGRKPVNKAKLQQVQKLVDNGTSVSKAVSEVGIGRRTYYKAIEAGRI